MDTTFHDRDQLTLRIEDDRNPIVKLQRPIRDDVPEAIYRDVAPKGGWDNPADVQIAKRYCHDMYGYVVAGGGDRPKEQLWEIFERLYHLGISQRTAVGLVMTFNRPPQEKVEVQLVASDLYRVMVTPPGIKSVAHPVGVAEWTPAKEEDDPNDFEGEPLIWPKPLVYDAKINSAKLAEVFLAHRPAKIIHSDGVLYTLEDSGIWREIPEDELAAEIRVTDPTLHLDTGKIFGMISAIRLSTFTKARPYEWIEKPEDAPDAYNLILFRNGILDFESGKLLPHTGQYFATGVPDYDYDPGATCPLFQEKLGQWLHPDYHPTLQEWFGYAMTPDTSIEVLLAMIGASRGGKGTVTHVLQQLVGQAHHCSRTLGDLSGEFGLEGTLDKTLLIIPDAHDVARMKRGTGLERIKCVTGRDDVSVNQKNKPIVVARIPAKIVMVANQHPKFLDESGALAARELLIIFDRSFRGREDKELRAKLSAELPGIANWALEGLRRLRENGRRFSIGERGRAASLELAESQSPMRRFARDYLTITGEVGDFETLADVYAVYRHWAEHEESLASREIRSRDDFKGDLIAAFRTAGVEFARRRVSGKGHGQHGKGLIRRRLFGLRLNPKARAILPIG
jgi:P4 family phage/plasmid primase-like protien